MFTHYDTFSTLVTMKHQERLREAANDRIAASAQARQGSAIASASVAQQIATRCSGVLQRVPASNGTRRSAFFVRPARQGA